MSYIDKRQQVDSLKAKIESFGELKAELKKKINYKFRLDWNYYSNSMEGNTLTMDETRSVMVGNITVEGKPLKDIMEIKGHDEIISDILKIGIGEMRLSEARIKEIHKGIMHEEDVQKRAQIGVWKKEPNYLYNYKGERFDFAAPAEVPELMHNLLNKTNAAIDAIRANKKDAPHPLDVAIQFHLDYIIIHPFYDGNGRTARILTNLLLISFGYPPFWVKNNETSIYNQYLGDIQGYGGDPNLFFEYCADMVLRSERLVMDAIEGKEINETGDLSKKLQMLKARLGQDPSARAEIKFSENAVKQVFQDSIEPLGQAWEHLLKDFDTLFQSRTILISASGIGGYSYSKSALNIEEGLDLFFLKHNNPVIGTWNLKEIKMQCSCKNLKSINQLIGINGGVITINFYENLYEINYLEGETVSIQKLYDQDLNENEIALITESLGNRLYENIEQVLTQYEGQ